MRPLRGRFTNDGNDDQPYRPELVWDSECDEPDGVSVTDSRPFAPVGWGPVAPCGGWASREHRAAALEAEAARRLGRRG